MDIALADLEGGGGYGGYNNPPPLSIFKKKKKKKKKKTKRTEGGGGGGGSPDPLTPLRNPKFIFKVRSKFHSQYPPPPVYLFIVG